MKITFGACLIIVQLLLATKVSAFLQQEDSVKDTVPRQIWSVGLGIEPRLSFTGGTLSRSSGDMKIGNAMPIESPSWGVGVAGVGNIILLNNYKLPLLHDSVNFGFTARFLYFQDTFEGAVVEPARQVLVNGVLTPLVEQNHIGWQSSYITLSFSGAVSQLFPKLDSSRFYISFGPVITFNVGQTLEQYSDIISPESYNYVETSSKTKRIATGTIDDANRLRLGLDFTIGYRYNLQHAIKQLTFDLSVDGEIGWRQFLTDAISNSQITFSGPVARLTLLKQL